MPRQPSSWFRAHDGEYDTTFRRQQPRLAQTEAEAQVAFHRLMAEKLAEPEKPREEKTAATKTAFAVIAHAFRKHSQKHNAPDTYCWHHQFLRSFAVDAGKVHCCDLTPYQFNRWMETKKSWKDGGRRGAVHVIKACLNGWCDQHHIPSHPLARLKPPPDQARDGILSPEDQQRVLDYLCPRDPFRDSFFALQQTG